MSIVFGIGCFAIAIGVMCWAFLGSYGFGKFFKYFLLAAGALVLVLIAFQVVTYLRLNVAQVTSLGVFVVVVISLFFEKGEAKKPKETESTKYSPPRSKIDRDTGRYL